MAFFDGHKTEEVTLENSALYEGELGASVIALECMQFEAELFEEAVRADAAEYSMIQEGTDTKVFVEGKFAEIKEKVVKFLEQVLAKLKAVFKGFQDRVVATLTRDTKALYNKFKDDVAKKDLTGLMVKIHEYKANAEKYEGLDKFLVDANKGKTTEELKVEIFNALTGLEVKASSEIRKAYAEYHLGEEKEVAYKNIEKQVAEALLGDWVKAAKDNQAAAEKGLSAAIATVKKESDKDAALVNNVCSAYTFVVNAICAENINVCKKYVAEARKAFQKAVAYKPVKEGEELDADLFLVECDLVEVEPDA